MPQIPYELLDALRNRGQPGVRYETMLPYSFPTAADFATIPELQNKAKGALYQPRNSVILQQPTAPVVNPASQNAFALAGLRSDMAPRVGDLQDQRARAQRYMRGEDRPVLAGGADFPLQQGILAQTPVDENLGFDANMQGGGRASNLQVAAERGYPIDQREPWNNPGVGSFNPATGAAVAVGEQAGPQPSPPMDRPQPSLPPIPQTPVPVNSFDSPPTPGMSADGAGQQPGANPAGNPQFTPGAAPPAAQAQGALAEPQSNAAMMGLLAAGLGILANNTGHYGQAGPAIGKGGLIGVQTYLQQKQLEQSNAFKANELKQNAAFQQATITDLQQRAELHKAQAAMDKRKLDIQEQVGKGLDSLFSGANGGVAPGQPLPAVAGPNGQKVSPGNAPVPTLDQDIHAAKTSAVNSSNGIFDPNIYAGLAGVHAKAGDPEGAQKWIGIAHNMASLQLQGYHTVNAGDKHVIMRGNQVVGEVPMGLSPKETFDLIAKTAESGQSAIKTEFETGVKAPRFNFNAGTGGGASGGLSQGSGTDAVSAAGGGMGPAAPGSPRSIYNNVPPKFRAEAIQQGINSGQKELEKDAEVMQSAQSIAEDARRFMDLNSRTTTGPIVGKGIVGGTRSIIPGSEDAKNLQEMEKIEGRLSMNNFKPGQGQISNMERGLIKSSGPNRGYEADVNSDIARVMIGGVQNLQDRNAFKQDFLAKNQTLNGAEAQWNEYVNANPRYIADQTKEGRLAPNDQRMEWQDWMALRNEGIKALPFKEGKYGMDNIDSMKLKQGEWYIFPGGTVKGKQVPPGPMMWKKGQFYTPDELK